MSPYRATTIGAVIVLLALLMGWVDHERNDLLYYTRSIASQARKAGPENARAAGVFAKRLQIPETDGADPAQSAHLYAILSQLQPEVVKYGDDRPITGPDGREHPHRQVVLEGYAPSGRPATLRLEWIQYRGNWYVAEHQGGL